MWFVINSNKRKTFILIVLLVLVFALFGFCFGAMLYVILFYAGDDNPILIKWGGIGAIASLFVSLGVVFYVKNFASKYFLNATHAKKLPYGQIPVLKNVVEEMSIASALGFTPQIYITGSPVPNAFAVGTYNKNSAICVSMGLLSMLTRSELQAVVAHEISHIKNKDTLYLMYAGCIIGIVATLLDFSMRSVSEKGKASSFAAFITIFTLLFTTISYILTHILYFAISRKREYLADACACQYTRYPQALASALIKISSYSANYTKEGESFFLQDIKATDGKLIPAMHIHNFLQKDKEGLNLFSTHPSIKSRIKVLKQMGAADLVEYSNVYSKVVSGKEIISESKLKSLNIMPLAIVAPELDTEIRETRQRRAKAAFKEALNYKIINCPCETILKIPPEFNMPNIKCPHCGAVHNI